MAKNDADTLFWCVTLPQLQWLIERMTARRDPITRQQVEVFGRHPAGPILPAECIAVERLPDTFGTRRAGQPPLEYDGPVHDLAVSPTDGNLWVATVINGESALRCFGRHVGTPEHEEPSNALRHLALRADGEGARYFSPRIVGFRQGAPVVRLRMYQSAWTDDAFVYIGQGHRFADQLPTTRISAISVTRDGAVLTAHPIRDDQWAVCRNGELLFRTQTAIGGRSTIEGLWEVGDRIAWAGQFDGLHMRSVTGSESPQETRAIVHDRDIRDVFMGVGALHYITTGSAGHGANLHCIDDGEIQSVWSSDGHTYLRGYTEFPDGRIAYIGETVRDERECWVVDDVAYPGFDRVTDLVFREGRARYWGCLGQHLYTMELPSITTHGVEL